MFSNKHRDTGLKAVLLMPVDTNTDDHCYEIRDSHGRETSLHQGCSCSLLRPLQPKPSSRCAVVLFIYVSLCRDNKHNFTFDALVSFEFSRMHINILVLNLYAT